MSEEQGIRYRIIEDDDENTLFKPLQNATFPPVQTFSPVPTFKIPEPNTKNVLSQDLQQRHEMQQDPGTEFINKIKTYISKYDPGLVILTPCYNSTVYVSYMESLIQTFAMCREIGLRMKVHFCKNDSLVSRAINNLIAKAMSDPKTTHMLFIDADITWDPIDIMKLLLSEKGIVGGIYPIKRYDWSKLLSDPTNPYNSNLVQTLMIKKNNSQMKDIMTDEEFLRTNMVKYNVNYESNVLNVSNNLAKVRHLATGFMMIKREVIETMFRGFPDTKYVDDVGFLEKHENDFAYALFDCGVEEGHYFSEDWMFCHRWTKMGGGVYIDVTINLDHTGIETFKGSYISSVI